MADDGCRYLIVIKRNIEIIIIKLITIHNVIMTKNFDFNEDTVVDSSIIFEKIKNEFISLFIFIFSISNQIHKLH